MKVLWRKNSVIFVAHNALFVQLLPPVPCFVILGRLYRRVAFDDFMRYSMSEMLVLLKMLLLTCQLGISIVIFCVKSKVSVKQCLVVDEQTGRGMRDSDFTLRASEGKILG